MFLVDLEERRFRSCNNACAKMLGYEQAEFPDLEIAGIHPREDLPFIYEQIGKYSRGEEGVRRDIRFKQRDGSVFYADISPALVVIARKRYLLITFKDITERKRAEDALRDSQQILAGILNTVPVRVFWKDKNLTYLGCNIAFARDAGFEKPEDIIGKNDYAMGWRDQAELYRADDMAVIESRRSKLMIEEPQTTPAGESIYLLTNKVPLLDPKGEVIGVLGTYLDITERKRAEDALQAEKERFRIAAQSLSDVIYDWDLGDRLEWFGNIDGLLGYAPGEFPRTMKAWEAILNPEDKDRVSRAIERQTHR